MLTKGEIVQEIKSILKPKKKYHVLFIAMDSDYMAAEQKSVFIKGCFPILFAGLANYIMQKTEFSLKDMGHILNLIAEWILTDPDWTDKKKDKAITINFFKDMQDLSPEETVGFLLKSNPILEVKERQEFPELIEFLKEVEKMEKEEILK